jgi:ribonuclease E
MSKLMLIDATHPEETRVAVVANGQIEDFDFEARNKRQLRGNIYLAKVTRVEPSLQAAFVEYGGNRHGFLAFGEIHPDYYQIPKEDRDALIAEAAEAEDDEDETPAAAAPEAEAGATDGEASASESEEDDEDDEDDGDDEASSRRRAAIFQRKYKIQEVIRRRQVMLVQVVKEERGNKGAALTTYLSLAGRYCVLMPNTSRAGGVSRKITNSADRKRLKAICAEFDIPRGAGLIVRTAGAKRTKSEIRRDFEYLTRLWQQIVSRTMESMAPALIHEEGHLVLRAVRDLYDKDVQQIIVDGDEAYSEAKTFVEMLMPAHAKKVVRHENGPPLFVATGVEDQLENIFTPTVRLPSGGYIVINQTEALVAIDVNSGKSTRERNVESTAVRTNLEAAAEACRQMRLRDLAGLVVIDFIDMEENKNVRAVERKMADALKIDRARVQTGRISQFGLFEISRQRRRAGVLELSSEPCPHCAGTGRVRSVESAALQVLRLIEARASDDRVDTIHVQAPADDALYILNKKRAAIAEIENENHVIVRIEANATLKSGECNVEGRSDGQPVSYRPVATIDLAKLKAIPVDDEDDETSDESMSSDDDEDSEASADGEDGDADSEDDEDARNRRRRGRRGGRRRRGGREDADQAPAEIEAVEAEAQPESPRREPRESRDDDRRGGRRRRRGRDRDRDNRNRIPDIAADGGEMLDAIASAPFLLFAEEAPADQVETPVEASAEPVVAGLPDASTHDGPEPLADADVPTFMTQEIGAEVLAADAASDEETGPAPQVEHEIAPTSAEDAPAPVTAEAAPAAVEAAPEAEAAPAEEVRRHSIHGPGTQPAETQPEDKPRRMGWWSKRRA